MKLRVLDLFCGAGGAAKGYHDGFTAAGFDVEIVGVDIKPQPNYPYTFVQADAMTYPLGGFGLVHGSPPCQAFSTMAVMPNAREHHDLLTPTRARLRAWGGPFVLENVPGAPMDVGPPSLLSELNGVTLCGSSFGLNNGTYELRRHRLFESNVPLRVPPPCRHRLPVVGFYGDHARTRQRTVAGHRDRGGDITGTATKMRLVRELMGIDWMAWSEANQAIPPAYTAFLAEQIAPVLMERAA